MKFKERPITDVFLRKSFYLLKDYDTTKTIYYNARKLNIHHWYGYQLIDKFKRFGYMDKDHNLTKKGKELQERFELLGVAIEK